MPSYSQYLAYAESQRFQPVTQRAFFALVKAGYNPVTKEWS